jgi:bifunctional non-homologous end joining protein LigD
MLLQKADILYAASDWTCEPKWDGFRVLASVRDGSVRLISRNGHSFTNLFGPVSDAIRGFPVSIVLDGEVIVINDKGQPDFEALQARLRPRNGKLPGHLCYMVFDAVFPRGIVRNVGRCVLGGPISLSVSWVLALLECESSLLK